MIYLTKPYFDEKELEALKQVLASGWVAGQGPKGEELKGLLRDYLDIKHVIPVSNCTSGLHLAILALGIKPGDEVIVSDYTFPAAGHAVLFCGAKPRFTDVKINTYNMEPELILGKINSKTKGIIVVHEFGLIAEMEPIMKIAREHGLKIIEDAACALGARYKEKQPGFWSDIAVFSFHGRKNVTCGEGGAVVTNNGKYASEIESLSCFGMQSAYSRQEDFSIPSFDDLGYNYKLADLNAAVIIEQIRKYPEIIERKRKLVELYNSSLQANKYVTTPIESKDCFHVYQTYAVVLDGKIDRDLLIKALREDDIQTNIGTYASHIQPVYEDVEDTCPNSLFLYYHSLALPLYYDLKEEEVIYVVDRLNHHIEKQVKNKS
ncbi:MAG: DegT/DnrJ/EryC1/StrS family aminotransferase [Candidatus Cloacimonetes bacterium]|nr:DegT/DnrJ/EryC1/StrS family aminotransferase [Candidatus Cloacimonadota bacterium]